MIKEKLRGYRARQIEIQQLEYQLAELEARMSAPRIQQITGMPGSPSPNNDQMTLLVARHADLQQRYIEKLADLTEAQWEVENIIDTLSDEERDIFRLRYIQGARWEDICVNLNYSWRQVHRIHSAALSRLEAKSA